MILKFTTSKHQCSSVGTCFKQVPGSSEQKGGGRVGTHFKNESDKHRVLVCTILECNQLFSQRKFDPKQMSVLIQASARIKSGKSQRLFCAVGDHVLLES